MTGTTGSGGGVGDLFGLRSCPVSAGTELDFEPLDLPLELEDWAIMNAALNFTLSRPTYLGHEFASLRNNFLLDLYDWAHALPPVLLSAD